MCKTKQAIKVFQEHLKARTNKIDQQKIHKTHQQEYII